MSPWKQMVAAATVIARAECVVHGHNIVDVRVWQKPDPVRSLCLHCGERFPVSTEETP